MSRKTILIATAIALIACAAIIAAALALRPAPGAEPEQQEVQEQVQEGEEAKADEQGAQAEGDATPALTPEQEQLISGYTDEEREVAALLASSTWTADKETASASFTESSFVEMKDGKEASAGTRFFAICALDATSTIETGANGERAQIDDATISVLLDDGSYAVMHLLSQTSTSSELPAITVTCSAFQGARSYLRVRAANALSVEGLDDEAIALMDGKRDELASTLSEWCAVSYPTATSATWDGKLTANWNANAVETSFMLNNQASSRVKVSYDMAYGTFAIDTGAGA